MRNNSHLQVNADGIVDLNDGTRHVQNIKSLLITFFEDTSIDEAEELLSDLLQMYVNPDPTSEPTKAHISNTISSVRRISNLLRKLESINNQVKGGASCA